jgi:hypothetical protein
MTSGFCITQKHFNLKLSNILAPYNKICRVDSTKKHRKQKYIELRYEHEGDSNILSVLFSLLCCESDGIKSTWCIGVTYQHGLYLHH